MTWFHKRRTSAPTPRFRPSIECLDERVLLSGAGTAYLVTDLVSDQPGVAAVTDPTLVNAWGISLNPNGGAFWVSSNGGGLSELYAGDVSGSSITQPFKVIIPGGGKPTGQVFNPTTDFMITDGTDTKAAVFIFAAETGIISGWNPNVGVAAGAKPPSVNAEVGFTSSDGAIYKGLALGQVGAANFLYATDFHNGKIDVIDGQFHQVMLGTNGFENFSDPNLPKGFAPFGIAALNGKLYVSYAQQDADAEDDVRGKGHGFIDVFETNGHFDGRLVSRGDLNSPWGMVIAPPSFGQFGGDLLVGNFGDGRIHAYDPTSGVEQGTLSEAPGHPVVINNLWGLAFGNGKTAGDANTLYFAAGPEDETHGLFGKITANAAGTNPVSAVLKGSDLIVTGSPDSDHIDIDADHNGTHIIVSAGGQKIGTFDTASISTIQVNGFAGNVVISVDPRIRLTTILDGGAGNDHIFGGGGSNILLGGPDNDVLVGGSARDILIGGDGVDTLFARGGDDILVGASTAYDANHAALLQILKEWNSTDAFSDRVAALRAGNGAPKLDSSTVIDDGVRDDLFGGPGLDWFLGTLPDRVNHPTSGELFN
jgi:uncharacterized protein (TIGR03118 family)